MADVYIAHLVCGTTQTGLWCAACALPSGVSVELLMLTDSGVSPAGVHRTCLECDDGQAVG